MARIKETGKPHPEVDRKVDYPVWPADKAFPLTPLEAWYVLQGWSVQPKQALSMDEFLDLPGMLEFADDRVMLRQS